MSESGIYESLITHLLQQRLDQLKGAYHIEKRVLDSAEAAEYLSRFLSHVLFTALETFPNTAERLCKQMGLSNALIKWLSEYLNKAELSENLLVSEGEILSALFESKSYVGIKLKPYVERMTPKTGLAQSELFTGSNAGLSLESELNREILSSNEICWLVSFIKWTGIRIFSDALNEAVNNGCKIRIITTAYMGATDSEAVEFLAALPNTEVRISYNTMHERLHAKAYLFLRNSGFDTGYIGSSNLSRSALTNGLEWNLKVTTQEIPHIIDKFKNTFETYWASSEFEPYRVEDKQDRERFKKALRAQRSTDAGDDTQYFFDLEPHPYQKEILEKLQVERKVHHRYRNLVVAATGTGKTVISAFDFRQFYKKDPATKLLFVAHREEILKQALVTFRGVLRSHDFGELCVGGREPEHFKQLFISVQSLGSRMDVLELSADYYDVIIIDEVHHIAAESYRPILERFRPKVLLGLTATPERHDGSDILADFCGVIAAELRLSEAINRRYLCPFQYFGVDDPVDIKNVSWAKGRYLPSELTKVYLSNGHRVGHILRAMQDILRNLNDIKALAFCVTQEHARFMAEQFNLKGVRSAVLTSVNAQERSALRNQLVKGEISILCVVDIFNEGVDIPEIDTVLFLRPTESLTVFLQQLGRGLRLSEGKECLTVLDFVGNAHPEYDFSLKFRALVGKSHRSIADDVEDNFPQLPLGCSIVLQKQAKEHILWNIRNAIINQKKLLRLIRGYSHQTEHPLSLSNFLRLNPQVSVEDLYKSKIDSGGGWSRLCIKAGVIDAFLDREVEQAMFRGISQRLSQCSSLSYLSFVQGVLTNNGIWDHENALEMQMAMMMHYDFWQDPGHRFGFGSLEASIKALTRDKLLRRECLDVLEHLLSRLSYDGLPMALGFPIALQMHVRYSRDEILAAFGEHQFNKKSSSREGVLEIKPLNCELLFVTLQKTEKKFSPTTLYHDYAINDVLFHWQSQNSARPDRGKGLSYVEHKKNSKKIILFVREQSEDELKRSMGFVNLGLMSLDSHHGSQPMNITWRLEEPIPPYLWGDVAKLAVG